MKNEINKIKTALGADEVIAVNDQADALALYMDRTNMYARAYELAEKAHRGQTRWDRNIPYITHPLAVADKFTCPIHKTVAILHDVVEDTEVTLEDINKQFGSKVSYSIDCLTKRDGEAYDEYIVRVLGDPVATAVKIEDITHNLNSLPDTLRGVRPKRDRYALALYILKNREKLSA